VRRCFVCGRNSGRAPNLVSAQLLPSGGVVDLCRECSLDHFKVAAAERKLKEVNVK
jgi:hypothetical protein